MSTQIKELYHHRSITEIATSRILYSFAQAIMAATWAELFVVRGFSDSAVGTVKFGASAASLILASLLPYFLQKRDESKIYPLSLIISSLAIISLLISSSMLLLIAVFAIMQLVFIVRSSTFSIIFRDSFKKFSDYSLAQGILGSAVCFAWFIGPILGGFIMSSQGANSTILAGGFIYLISSITVLRKLPSHKTKKITASPNPLVNIKRALKLKGFKRAYLIKSGVDAWWTLIFAFVPLLMIRSGYSLSAVGLFIGFSQLPLVFAEFLTVRTLKKYTFRKIFTVSYLSLSLLVVIAVVLGIGTPSLILLVLASIPLAFLEPITEIYFYKLANKEQEELDYPIYLTASNFGEGGLSLMIWILLGFFNLSLSLIAAAFYMFVLFLAALKTQE